MTHQPIPKFATAEEEASWWDAHPEVLAERFRTARQQGSLSRRSSRPRRHVRASTWMITCWRPPGSLLGNSPELQTHPPRLPDTRAGVGLVGRTWCPTFVVMSRMTKHPRADVGARLAPHSGGPGDRSGRSAGRFAIAGQPAVRSEAVRSGDLRLRHSVAHRGRAGCVPDPGSARYPRRSHGGAALRVVASSVGQTIVSCRLPR